jgi:hypothetical protein
MSPSEIVVRYCQENHIEKAEAANLLLKALGVVED